MTAAPRRTLALALVAAATTLPTLAHAQTMVPFGNLIGNQTWTAGGSPYVLTGDVTVPSGTTLTIQAGAVVQMATGDQAASFDTARIELRIAGSLQVTGDPANPVIFTSGAAVPTTGAWYGVVALAGSTVSIGNATFRYGLRCVHNQVAGTTLTNVATDRCGYGVWADGVATTINGGDFASSATYGIYGSSASTLTVDNATVRDSSSYGVYVQDGTLNLTRSVIRNNGTRGIYVRTDSQTRSHTIRHNTIHANGTYGIHAYQAGGSLTVTIRDNLIIGNGTNGVYAQNFPNIVNSNNLLFSHSSNYNGVSAGTGDLQENPLVVDLAGRDYRPTSRSGLRNGASDGMDIGALPFDGVATTELAGHLFANTTLTAAASPHVVAGDLTVRAGVTLTIEPGATLRFVNGTDLMSSGDDASRPELRVLGTLSAAGTQNARITFTSNAGTQAPGDWYGIRFFAGAASSLIDYATIQFAVYGVRSAAPNTNAVRRSTLERSSSYGVYVDGGALELTELIVRNNNSYGIYSQDAAPTIRLSRIHENGTRGIYVRTDSQTRTVTIQKNTIHANGTYGIHAYQAGGSLTVNIRDNLILGNGTNGVYAQNFPNVVNSNNLLFNHSSNYNGVSAASSDLQENPLVVDISGTNRDYRPTSRSGLRNGASDGTDIGALPYDGVLTPNLTGHLFTNLTLTAAGSPHLITGDLIVRPGVTLTVEPGATVRVASRTDEMSAYADTSRVEIRVLGTLLADATASSNITFTSNAGTPMPGDWYGIWLYPGSTASLIDYATINYAVYGIRSQAPAGTIAQRSTLERNSSYGVYVDAGAILLDQLTVRNNSSYGIYSQEAAPTIQNSRIYDNGTRGIYVRTDSQTRTVNIYKNTIVGNGTYGVHAYQAGGSLTVNLRDNIMASNGTNGIYAQNFPNVVNSYNLYFGQSSNLSGVSLANTEIVENPLFVNLGNRDLRVTSNSPARRHGLNGTDIGALAYDGTPTVGVQGRLYDNTTWTSEGGTISVLGDITVEPGVTLTIQPGTRVEFAANADSMGGNVDTSRTELRVLGRLIVDGDPASRVTLTTAAAPPARGGWYGVHLTNTSANSSIENALISYATYGIRSQGPATNAVRQTEVTQSSSYGLYIDTGASVFDGVSVHDNASYGVYVSESAPVLNNMLVYSNGTRGFYVRTDSQTRTVVINHATVWGNGTYGIHVYQAGGSLTARIRNSLIADNGTNGIYAQNFPNVIVSYNNLWGHTANYNGLSADGTSISVNPQFVDSTVRNFHLLQTSQVVDAADPTAANTLTTDIEGLMRPLDGDSNGTARSDIGAFEFNPVANRWPIADAGPDRIVTSGTVVTFNASGSVDTDGTIVSYVWDFGDGTPTATGAMVTHTFNGRPATPGGIRTVTLTVTDNAGATDTDTASVEVNTPPVAEAGTEKFADPNETITFTGSGSTDSDGTISTYQWNFGDGGTATGLTVSKSYATGGDYTVTLTVTDDDGATATDTTIAHITGGDQAPPTINHTPLMNGRVAGVAQTINAQVTDPSGVSNVTLFYRTQGAATYSQAAMTQVSTGNYQASIPAATVVLPGVQYYIRAVDSTPAQNAGTSPAGAPGTVHSFTVTAPTPPAITHTPLGGNQPWMAAVTVNANVTAQAGVANVTLYYRTQGTMSFSQVAMMNTGGAAYSAQIAASVVLTPGVDYYITATDSAMPQQTTSLPATAPAMIYNFTVAPPAPPSITHTPIAAGRPFMQAVTVEASVTSPAGVAGVTLFNRTQGGGAYSMVAMVNTGGNTWSAQIPGATVAPPAVEYYLSARDSSNPAQTTTSPAGAPGSAHRFTVMGAPAPVINHTPVANGRPFMQAVTVDASVTSGVGVGAVTLFYRTQGTTTFSNVMMTSAGGNQYTAAIPAGSVTNPAVEYYLRATDQSAPAQETLSPAGAPATLHSFTVLPAGAPAITHTPITGPRPWMQAVTVDASVTAQAGVASVTLYYRAQGGTTFQQVSMTGSGGNYSAAIPASAVANPGVDYYIRVQDNTAGTPQVALSPAGAPATVHNFAVSPAGAPAIVHTRVADGQQVGVAVPINATVTAQAGIASVRLYYRTMGAGTFSMTAMTAGAMNAYSATIPAGTVAAPGVEYYLEATDSSQPAQTVTNPIGGGFHSFTVRMQDTTPPAIVHTAPAGARVEGTAVTVTATITDTTGVGAVNLFYRTMGTPSFTMASMTSAGGNRWTATIPGTAIQRPAVEYYISAADTAMPANSGVSPNGAPNATHRITVTRSFNIPAGAIIVTEIMENPSGSETTGEWFEVYNTTSNTIDLDGFVFRDDGSDNFTVNRTLLLPPSTYAVFGRSSDTAVNGGVPVDYVYSGMTLANTADEIVIVAGAVTVDRVAYDNAGFPHREGYAMSLDPMSRTGAGNDSGMNWCSSSMMLMGGDYGTPRSGNPSCRPAADMTPPSIVHTPIGGGQPAGTMVTVSAMVTDATGVQSVTLFYRVTGAAQYTQIVMVSPGGGNYQAQIPASAVTVAGVQYYLRAVDSSMAMNAATDPPTAPTAVHAFTVTMEDHSGPTITHTPISGTQMAGMSIAINATIDDPSGLMSATLYHRVRGATMFNAVPMMSGGGASYSAEIPMAGVRSPAVEYYLEAIDRSAFANVGRLPAGGTSQPFSFIVRTPDQDPPVIAHTPIAGSRGEGATVAITATVSDASGIGEVRVYFRATGSASFTSMAMALIAPDRFAFTFPTASIAAPGVDYYLEAVDDSDEQNTARHPMDAPATFHTFTVERAQTEDTTPPAIAHTPPGGELRAGFPISITAEITDASGVASGSLHYRAADATDFTVKALVRQEGTDTWRAQIPAADAKAGKIEYWIEAIDLAPAMNKATAPAMAPDEVNELTITGNTTDGGQTEEPTPRDGGCSCNTSGEGAGTGLSWAAMALAGVALVLRRRTRR